MKSTIKNRFFLALLLHVLLFILPTTILFAAAPGPGFDPSSLKPEEIDELLNMADSNYAKLSPEEKGTIRTQFVQQVKQTQKNLEKIPQHEIERFASGQMSPEEMELFVTKATTGEGLDATPWVPEPEPEAPGPTPESVQEVQQQPAPITPAKPVAKTTEDTASIIRSIIKRTESFLLKLQTIPDIDRRLISWHEKNSIPGAQITIEWHVFRYDLEKFLQRLHSLIAQDAQNKRFFYAQALEAETPTMSTLKALAESLNALEPLIEVPPFGVGKISKASKASIKKLIGTFLNVIRQNKVDKQLDDIIAKYEPEAKKLREQLAALEQKAQEYAGRARLIAPSQTSAAGGRGQPQFSDRYARPDGYSTGYRAPDRSGYPFGDTKSEDKASDGKKKDGGKKGSKGGDQAAKGDKKPEKAKESSRKKEEPPKPLTKDEQKAAQECYVLVAQFGELVQKAIDVIKKSTFLKDPYKNLVDKKVPIDEPFQEAVTAITSALGLRKGALDVLNRISNKMNSLPGHVQQELKDQVADTWKKAEPVFTDLLRKAGRIKRLMGRSGSKSVSDAKRYFYLGEKDQKTSTNSGFSRTRS